jgi:hypothetical protein
MSNGWDNAAERQLREHEAIQAYLTAEYEATHCRIVGCDERCDCGDSWDGLCPSHADRGEIVSRAAPAWAWELIDETLAMDAQSKAFDEDTRKAVGRALAAMILASEEADENSPIYEDDDRLDDND